MMKYNHKMRDFVKEYASVREVCSLEGIYFNSSKRADCPICRAKAKLTIKDDINNFKCWSCEAKGDGITLYSKIHNVDFKEAVIGLAEKFGYQEDAEVQVAKVQEKEIKKVEIKKESKKELSEDKINLYHNVYDTLAQVCGITPADKDYIRNRGVKENKMEDFFSLRNVNDVKMGQLIMMCAKEYSYTVEDIASVPGFMLRGKRLKLAPLYGLALKARNAQGKIIGIQVRTQFEDTKYLWLSSDKFGGASCGTPVSVDYPLNVVDAEKMSSKELIENSASTVFIGEGKFKNIAINQEFNSIAIGLAGVNNWRGRVKQELDYINNIRPVKNIMIAFDADMCFNFLIAEQFMKMMEEELSDYTNKNVRVAIWDIRYGKGIDDMIENGHRSKLKSIPFSEFVAKYNEFKDRCEKLGLTKDDKTERTMIYNQLFHF
ncbi:MAG: DUF3854 domain-containing protein [Clostridium sp.]|nr:DUF3854 domain-containing protein [Clostridium sp.]